MKEFSCVFMSRGKTREGAAIGFLNLDGLVFFIIKGRNNRIYKVITDDIRHAETIGESNFYLDVKNWDKKYNRM